MRLAIGCVADSAAKYLDQAERLLQSWRWFAGRYANADFHVCIIGDVRPGERARYEKYGAHVHSATQFSARHAPSNKLRFLELDATRDAERVLLLDCDTIVVQEPVELFQGEALIAKIADVATVPPSILERIYAAFGVASPPASCRCTVSDELTIPYFNTGVLSFSAGALKVLAPAWIRYNRMLIERIDLLEERRRFCDQASLSVAAAATKTPFTMLDNRMNFPAHYLDCPVTSSFGQTDPVIIHYHWLVDDTGRLQRSPYPNVDRRIESFNTRLSQESHA